MGIGSVVAGRRLIRRFGGIILKVAAPRSRALRFIKFTCVPLRFAEVTRVHLARSRNKIITMQYSTVSLLSFVNRSREVGRENKGLLPRNIRSCSKRNRSVSFLARSSFRLLISRHRPRDLSSESKVEHLGSTYVNRNEYFIQTNAV